jgi:hypothetical protein
MVRTTISELAVAEQSPSDIAPSALVDLYQRATAVGSMLDRFKAAIKAQVEQAGGIIATGNGQALKIIDAGRDVIDARTAWPILSKELSQDELNGCTTIKKTEMLDAIGNHAPRGQKKLVKQAIMEKLTAAGAVTRNEFTMLRVVRSEIEAHTKEIGNGE